MSVQLFTHCQLRNYYQAINCPVFNGTSEHLSQLLKVAQYSHYFTSVFTLGAIRAVWLENLTNELTEQLNPDLPSY